MSDIVNDLRTWMHSAQTPGAGELMEAAADEICTLRLQLKQWEDMAMHLITSYGVSAMKSGFYEGALLAIREGADPVATSRRALERHADPEDLEPLQVSDK
jgi:hypothetical protein